MTLWEMLDKTLYYGNILIYSRNACDQCMPIFKGRVYEARSDENVWDYLPNEIDQWICGNKWMLVYVKYEYFEDRLEEHYLYSDKWTRDNHPYKSSYEVEKLLMELNN